jgi:predicted GIY-YIG superfamily endonuclease
MRKKKYIYSEEQLAQKKITDANWYQENKKEQKRQMQEWAKKNPGYYKEWHSQHDLGYWVVYLIHNFDGLGNIYCGQTQNIYNRMKHHKCIGRLNTDKHELIKQCKTRRDALDFEAYMHEQGYHGKSGRPLYN